MLTRRTPASPATSGSAPSYRGEPPARPSTVRAMELRQLTCFLAVAEELHSGRAAERLHVVQSAVSRQIQRLERDLGAELFDRSPRRVRLTGAGERPLPEARAVPAAADRARAAVAASAGPTPPHVRTGGPTPAPNGCPR